MADVERPTSTQLAAVERVVDLLSETLRGIVACKRPEAPQELRDFAGHALDKAADIIAAAEQPPPPKRVFAWVAYHPDWSGVAIFRDELDAYKHAVDQGMQVVGVREGGDPREAVARG